MTDILHELEGVRAKRNAALTIFGAEDLNRFVTSIKKQISCIKHESKRGQLLWVVKHLEQQIKENSITTGICCVAAKVDGSLYFKHIPTKVWKNEYYYDDCFHLLKIQEVLLSIPRMMPKEIAELERDILENGDYYQLDATKIMSEADDIRTIYHTIVENGHIPLEFLQYPVKLMELTQLNAAGTPILKLCKTIARRK